MSGISPEAERYNQSGSDSDWNETETPSVRWAPLGAVADSTDSVTVDERKSQENPVESDINILKEENEKVTNSLFSLTSHFAQVQFRLKQIIDGPDEMKAERLKELDLFAEKGIPDVKSCITYGQKESDPEENEEEYQKRLNLKQREMIFELKSQLADLENYAYQNGFAEELPTSTVLEKQEVIIQQIKRKLQISHFDNLASLSSEELKECVDEAIAQIVNPAKAKEKQLEQLRTQVNDLERFVDFLQAEVTNKNQDSSSSSKSAPTAGQKRLSPKSAYQAVYNNNLPASSVRTQGTGSSQKSGTEDSESTSSRIKRILGVIHLFILSELGCASRQRDKARNEMKERAKEPHYGDMLAEMQMSIDELVELVQVKTDHENVFADCDYISDEEAYISENKQVTQCVRKKFCISLRKLIEHGAVTQKTTSGALMPLGGCAPSRSVNVVSEDIHAWRVILAYYDLKDGKAFNETPSRKLADSFGIRSGAECEMTVTHSLLGAIGRIIETHTPYHRSDDAHFKAFISLALNEKKLVPWLRQILRASAVVDQFYQTWSYLVKTSFEDVFCSLNKLKLYDFQLPVDLAVKQFNNIKDAF